MPMPARWPRISSASRSVLCSSGILTIAMLLFLLRAAGTKLAPRDFEQELQNLYVALRLGQIFPPRVEAVAAQHDPVRVRVFFQSRFECERECRHVLRVIYDGEAFAVLVRPHAGQPLQHL